MKNMLLMLTQIGLPCMAYNNIYLLVHLRFAQNDPENNARYVCRKISDISHICF